MRFDSAGNLLLACGKSIRRISPSTSVTTIAGSFSQSGYTNGPGNLARFTGAYGICAYQGVLYVADSGNYRIRSITFNPVEQPVAAASLGIETHPVLNISGIVGRTYRIESSHDAASWVPEITLLLTRTPYLWLDENAVSGNKFYRAFLLP
jgi:hypothetical protein